MAVHEQRGRIGAGVAPFTDHDGMPRRGLDGGGEADPRERVSHELRRLGTVGFVLGPRTDARDAKEGEQFVLRTRIVGAAPGGEISGNRGSGHA